jgi:hypothetical protein
MPRVSLRILYARINSFRVFSVYAKILSAYMEKSQRRLHSSYIWLCLCVSGSAGELWSGIVTVLCETMMLMMIHGVGSGISHVMRVRCTLYSSSSHQARQILPSSLKGCGRILVQHMYSVGVSVV